MYSNRSDTALHSRHGRRPEVVPHADGNHMNTTGYQPKQDLFVVLQNAPDDMAFYPPGGKQGMAAASINQQQPPPGPVFQDDALGHRIRSLVREEMNGDNEAEEEPSMADVGFPGLNNVLDKSMIWIGRIIWVAIIICCVVFCVYQVADRIQMYFNYPTTANVRIVANSTIKFPSFTLCGVDTIAIVKLKKEYLEANNRNTTNAEICNVTLPELVNFQSKDVYEIWKLSSVNQELRDITFTLNPGNKELVTRAEEPTLYGICTTFTVEGEVNYYGAATNLQIVRNITTAGCTRNLAYIMMAQEDGHYADVKGSWTISNGTTLGLSIQVKEFNAINTPTNPCISAHEASQCLKECVKKKILEAVSCRLPFMGRSDLPRCSTGPEALEAYRKSESIMLETDASEDCKCTRKCKDTIYTITRESFSFTTDETKMLIYYSDNHFEVVSEDLSYVLVALLCDVGGNLGLYLGLSVLSVFEITQSIFEVRKKKEMIREARKKQYQQKR